MNHLRSDALVFLASRARAYKKPLPSLQAMIKWLNERSVGV